MKSLTRRQFLYSSTAAAISLAGVNSIQAGKPAKPQLTLGFSLYGMPHMKTEQALQVVADVGYDSVELCLMDAWDATPLKLNPQRRAEVSKKLNASGLKLTSLMEHCDLTGSKASQQKVLERLKRAAELGHTLKPEQPPLIETTAGSENGMSENMKCAITSKSGPRLPKAQKRSSLSNRIEAASLIDPSKASGWLSRSTAPGFA